MEDKYQTAVALASDTKHNVVTVETKSTPPCKPYMERFLMNTLVNDEGKEIQVKQNMSKTSN